MSFLDASVSEIFNRMLREGAYAASEMSFAYGLMAHARGTPPLVTLPVYPYRTFRHSSLFVRKDGPVRSPRDLPGSTFAVHDFFAADPLWIRGTLRDLYGVDPRSIKWLQYTFRDRMPLPTLEGYQIERQVGADPTDLLLSGQADVAFSPDLPAPYRDGTGPVRPLFDDPLAEEEGYFRETGILPLLHGFVMRRDVYEASPGLASALYQALEASKAAWYRSLYATPSSVSGVPLFTSLTLKVHDLMGVDFWPYGLERNRHAIAKGIEYAAADGLIAKPFDPAELFPAELRHT